MHALSDAISLPQNGSSPETYTSTNVFFPAKLKDVTVLPRAKLTAEARAAGTVLVVGFGV